MRFFQNFAGLKNNFENESGLLLSGSILLLGESIPKNKSSSFNHDDIRVYFKYQDP